MKKIIVLLLISLLNLGLASAQNNKYVKSVLWKVEYPKTGSVSYVLGSRHDLGETWLNKFRDIKNLIDSTDVMYSEVGGQTSGNYDLDSLKGGSAQTMDYFFGKDSATVDSIFTSFFGGPLSAIISPTAPLPNNGLEVQKMFLVALKAILSKKLCVLMSNKLGLTDENFDVNKIEVLDGLLEQMAKKANKKLIALDDTKYMKGMLIADSSAAQNFVRQINDIRDFQNNISNKAIHTLERDLKLRYDGLSDYEICYTTKLKDADPVSHLNRNKVWGNRLKSELKNTNAFIVFGSAHLFFRNKYGVLDILRKNGFKITPINMLEL